MIKQRLSDPGIYTPMSVDELHRLGRYRARVDQLQTFRFFTEGNETLHMFGAYDGVTSAGRDDFDHEGLSAIMTPVRILHDPKAATGFVRVVKLLGEHLRTDVPDYGELVTGLRELRKEEARDAKRLPLGITLEKLHADGTSTSESISAPELLDAWLYGDIFHDDLDKDAIRERFNPGETGLYNLCWIIRRLNRHFVHARDLVAPILDAAGDAQAACSLSPALCVQSDLVSAPRAALLRAARRLPTTSTWLTRPLSAVIYGSRWKQIPIAQTTSGCS